MAARKDTTPAEPNVTITIGEAKPDGSAPVVAIGFDWTALKPAVRMPNKVSVGNIKVNVLESVPEPIRKLAESSLDINAKAVAAKSGSKAKRARVNYEWDVQPVNDKAMAEALDRLFAKYAKYRPATGDIPHRADHSPMGQITVRTGEPGYYRVPESGEPEDRQREAQGHVGHRDVVTEAELYGGEHDQDGAAEVHHGGLA